VVTIQHGGEHLLALVGDILDFAKHHAGKLEVRLERVDPVDVAEAALRLVQGAAERKHIDLRLTRDLSLPPLLADERRVTQILVNLLGNALKFTEPWGLVTLDVRMGAGRTDVHFAVTDTGIGIAEKDLSKLFLPFEQGESELGRQHPGTGLGLSLVAALVSLHNGSVSAKSVPGRGSRFEVVLPAHA
jgi:signal transduction histidine kinase